jgi:hypothetical protein
VFATQTGLVVAGQRLVQIDEFCVVAQSGREANYHGMVTFEAPSTVVEAEFVYHGGKFHSNPSVADVSRTRMQGLSHHMGLSRVQLGFTPPIQQGGWHNFGIEAALSHTVPLDRFLRYTGERGLDELLLEVYFDSKTPPKQIWRIEFAFDSGKPVPTEEYEVESQPAVSGDDADDHYRVSLELKKVAPNIEVGFRWQW